MNKIVRSYRRPDSRYVLVHETLRADGSVDLRFLCFLDGVENARRLVDTGQAAWDSTLLDDEK